MEECERQVLSWRGANEPLEVLAGQRPVDTALEHEHVSKQPGFVSRESAHGLNGEWLVIVHWQSAEDADASMASFEKAPAAAPFMSRIEASTMSMKRYER